MAHENVDNEIDQYLVDKISKAINLSGEPKNLVAKSYSFKAEFASLLRDLSRTTNPKVEGDWGSIRRGSLYSLNNSVTEWLQICKNHPPLSAKEVYDACEDIKKSLSKIKKDVSGEQKRKINKDVSGEQEGSSKGGPDGSGSVSLTQQPDYPIFKRHTGQEVYRWSSRHAPRKVHGFDHKVLLMERELIMKTVDSEFKVFGVVGAPGIGKTTLCQAVFGRGSVKEHFSPRIWVCLSKQQRDRPDYREEIVVRMLQCLGIDDEVIDAAGNDPGLKLKRLILLLRLQLIGKRYLIILDDAWNNDKFFHNLKTKDQLDETWGEELAYALPKGDGGTVISSSRSEALLKDMLGEDVSLQHMEPLNREIIYNIFKDAVIGYDDDERDYHKDLDLIKKEVLDKCDGVPFAAKLLAKIAWKNLEIKPKSQQPSTGGGESGHDVEKLRQAVVNSL